MSACPFLYCSCSYYIGYSIGVLYCTTAVVAAGRDSMTPPSQAQRTITTANTTTTDSFEASSPRKSTQQRQQTSKDIKRCPIDIPTIISEVTLRNPHDGSLPPHNLRSACKKQRNAASGPDDRRAHGVRHTYTTDQSGSLAVLCMPPPKPPTPCPAIF